MALTKKDCRFLIMGQLVLLNSLSSANYLLENEPHEYRFMRKGSRWHLSENNDDKVLGKRG
jgi:hypothetical protein